MKVRQSVWASLLSFLVASWSTAQESPGASQTLSLAEIDRQLNNPLAKTWALVLQNNTGIFDGDLVDGTATSNVLFFQPLLPIPVGKIPTKLRAEVHYSVIRPDSFGEKWNIRLQITPVIKSPFM